MRVMRRQPQARDESALWEAEAAWPAEFRAHGGYPLFTAFLRLIRRGRSWCSHADSSIAYYVDRECRAV